MRAALPAGAVPTGSTQMTVRSPAFVAAPALLLATTVDLDPDAWLLKAGQ